MKHTLLSSLALVALAAFVAVTAVQAEDPPAATPTPGPAPFILQAVEEKYSTEAAKGEALVTKAEGEAAGMRKTAADARLKAYREKLAEFTKAGDFDKAVAVKARIEQLEKEPGAVGEKTPKRARPKDAVKFNGHWYALIKEPATWHVAKRKCEEMGGHLACATNAKEAEFLARLCGETCTFVGASSEEHPNEWQWVNGAHGFTGFSVEIRPDPEAMFLAFDHKWLNGRSGTKCAFICEWDK